MTLPDKAKRSQGEDTKRFLNQLGQLVRNARAKRGMTRKILAKDSGVSERYLAQLESGTGNPSVAVLHDIAAAMDLPINDLISGGENRPVELRLINAMLDRLSPNELERVRFHLNEWLPRESDAKAKRISLIGLRGGGKSTLGQMLADQMNAPFLELDRLVEKEYGASIGEILALSGQPAFRRYEQRCLEMIIDQYDSVVIAAGGGIVANPAGFSLLIEKTLSVWIKADPQEHMDRVVAQGDLRPMADNAEAMADLQAILDAREAFYGKADIVIDTSRQSVDESFSSLQTSVAEHVG